MSVMKHLKETTHTLFNSSRPFGDNKKFRKKIENFKKRKMRILNSLIVPKNVRGGHLGFFNIHSVAKHQKIEGVTL